MRSDESEEYCGPEHRVSAVSDRRLCPMDTRIIELEKESRTHSAQLKAITTCLNGYKSFIEVLKAREEQNMRLREKLIERGIAATVFAAAGAVLMLVWAGFVQYLKAKL